MKIKNPVKYFSRAEIWLWSTSVAAIAVSFFVFGGRGYLTLCASLIGVTSLILNAKGNPRGQVLMIAFSVMYGIISYGFSYYGEMLTYLGMTAPMALAALVSWLRHPSEHGRSEVRVNALRPAEYIGAFFLCIAVTAGFSVLLSYLGTTNIVISTVSVFTSFAAAYLTFRRSEFFSAAYAANDIVLIVMWILASLSDSSYISVVICFAAFLANDIYGFISWRSMRLRQSRSTAKNVCKEQNG